MSIFTDTQTFGPYRSGEGPVHVIIKANGGSVNIEAKMSDGVTVAIPDAPFTTDTTFQLNAENGQFVVTPSGGATYEWSHG